jgi:GNAT superfamily N-acetyltransferase
MSKLRVSYLALREPPAAIAEDARPPGIEISRQILSLDDYLALYKAVGGPWGWDQRLNMPRNVLSDFLAGPACHIFNMREDARTIGLCEFDSSGAPDVQLMNFGLIPEVFGRGLGPSFLHAVLRQLWGELNPRRVWLHTDEWDHPKAHEIYLNAGFVVDEERLEDPADL